jgi:hypothetical protein
MVYVFNGSDWVTRLLIFSIDLERTFGVSCSMTAQVVGLQA